MRSLGEELDKYKGIGPGFDFIRIFLALTIVAVHTFILSGHRHWVEHGQLWFVEVSLVPMFFALSGFLVSASGQRLSLKNFLINRGLRIVPALTVDVIVCALILGPLVTTVSLQQYFSDPQFFRYFFEQYRMDTIQIARRF
jgi:peptidoglycan/LPS O-acetylase OafA/YrhL